MNAEISGVPLSHLFQKIKQHKSSHSYSEMRPGYHSDIVVKAWGVFWRISSGLGVFYLDDVRNGKFFCYLSPGMFTRLVLQGL